MINLAIRIPCSAAAAMLASFSLLGAPEEVRPAGNEIENLIQNLAAESYRLREDATRDLWVAGEKASASLRKASKSDDPEMAIRAAEVLEKIELHITPDTPQDVVDLIHAYRDASQDKKVNFLNELKRRKAYFQVLHLYANEDRPEIKEELAPIVRGVAILGAREAIVDGDMKMAVKLLEMSSGEASDLMALASLYRTLGTLDEHLKNPQAPAGVSTDLWKITMLRANGDLEAAARIAAQTKQTRLLAGINILLGDPTLWLAQNGLSEPTRQADNDYIKIALKRWEGKNVPGSDFNDLLATLKQMQPDSEERAHAVASLASLGRLTEIETATAKIDPFTAFEYLLSQERIQEALKVIGLDPEKPDYVAWVKKQFGDVASARADDQDENEEENGDREKSNQAISKLEIMAGFMESRGLTKEIAAAFDAPLADFAKRNENHFLDFLGSIFQSGFASKYAAKAASEWAGDDNERWNEVFIIAFGEDNEAREWLNWISKIDPELTNPAKIDVMQALFKVGIDPENLREKWLQRVWKAIEETPEKDRTVPLKRIMTLGVSQQDVATSLKAWNMLDVGKAAMWSSMDKYLSAAGDWKGAVELLDQNEKFSTSSSPELHAYLAATLRKAGDEKRALQHDRWAEKLSLGYAPSCKRIGDYYIYGGDPKRAAIWYQRAAFQADPAENEFTSALNSYATLMNEQGNWKIAASCFEALMQVYASRGFVNLPPAILAKARLNADLAKALAILPENRERAIELLEAIHSNFATDGVLADEFFPMVRNAGLIAEHDRWFAESWKRISEVIKSYPGSDNTRNTAAWLASRAQRKLSEAKAHLEYALGQRPEQAAYLDTMAETHFAMGDRKGAIKYSDEAIMFYPLTDGRADLMIRKQNHRFHHAPVPK